MGHHGLRYLRSRAAFSDFLVTLLKAFRHYHDHSAQVAKAAIRARTHEVDRAENSQRSSGQSESESEDEDEDEDGVGLRWCSQRHMHDRHKRRVFLAVGDAQRTTRTHIECHRCQKFKHSKYMVMAHQAFNAAHREGDQRIFNAETEPTLYKLECTDCNSACGARSAVVFTWKYIYALGGEGNQPLRGWPYLRRKKSNGSWSGFKRRQPWGNGPGYDMGLIPKPTVHKDGTATWALKPGTVGGMYSISEDGVFAEFPDLASTAATSSFTPSSASPTRTSPRQRTAAVSDSDEDEITVRGERKKATLQSKKRKDTTEAEGRKQQTQRKAAKVRRRAHFQGRTPLTPQPYI